MKKAKVQMDGFNEELDCLYNPSNKNWNGFANPYLEKPNFDKWVAWLKKEESDNYEEVKNFPSEEIDGKLYFYCGGAYTWSYVEEPKTTLLEDLEDIVGQYQMDKMTREQVIKVLSNIVEYEKKQKKEKQ